MERQRYGIGEQSFKELIEGGYVYVDKTGYIPLLLRNKYYFLSRPRRFGKSLLLSTLEHFFRGHRALFKGLAADSMVWDWAEYPVIRIDLTSGMFTHPEGLERRLVGILERYEKSYGVEGFEGLPNERLSRLIYSLQEKFGREVVVLVDEYEKPLLDCIDKPDVLESNLELLRGFYSVLKSQGENLKFVFLTGITRFGHLNIFSGLNNIYDISLHDDYSAICGITQEELLENFKEGIAFLARDKEMAYEEAVAALKRHYDGYHFSGRLVDVYNPYSLLMCLNDGKMINHWFISGSSSYLLDILREKDFDITNVEGIRVNSEKLLGVNSGLDDPVTLLYQSGYLTIKAYDSRRERYRLGLPNEEVKYSLYGVLIPYYLRHRDLSEDSVDSVYDYLCRGKAKRAMEWLQSFFGSIPYDVHLNYEKDFQMILYSFFALVGLLSDCQLEKQTARGRIDMVLTMKRYVYVMEFKLGDSARKAIEQINARDYALPWRADGRKVFKIGVAFSAETRGISEFIIEEEK